MNYDGVYFVNCCRWFGCG